MINKLTVGGLCLALAVSCLPMPAAADTLRSLSVENPQTRVGLEESLLGRALRSAKRQFTRYLALAGLMANVAQGPAVPTSHAAPPPVPQPATTLPRAIISPTTLTLTFPAAVTGQPVAAYLRTDQWYRVGTNTIPENGVVTFTVSVNPPNFPGWIAAGDRVMAVFPRGTAPPDTSTTPNIRGATLAVRIATNGPLTVVTGRWPASPFQVGAGPLAPLRQFLGPQRQVGLLVQGSLPQILTMTRGGTNFFGLAADAGYNTVWISGTGFTRLSPADRQELVHDADATLETLGFIQSGVDVANPAERANVLQSVDAQVNAVLGVNLGNLTVQWMTDFEPQLAPPSSPWNGDMTAVMDTTEQIVDKVEPLRQGYRVQHPEVTRDILREPVVLEFGGTWRENGQRPDPSPGIVPGAVVHGIRPIRGIGLAGATFQNTVDGIAASGNGVSHRAAEESAILKTSVLFLYIAETSQTDGRTFSGQVPDAGPTLLGALQRVPLDRVPLMGGVGLRAANPTDALSGFRQLLSTTTIAVSPNGRTYVWRAASDGQTSLRFWTDATSTGSYTLPSAFANARLIPQFNGDEYLFGWAQAGNGASRSDGFVVFGTRRPTPGATRGVWTARPLSDSQGSSTVFLDRDLSNAAAGPIVISSILPDVESTKRPNNDIVIGYSFTNDLAAPSRTMVLTITPAGLEEVEAQRQALKDLITPTLPAMRTIVDFTDQLGGPMYVVFDEDVVEARPAGDIRTVEVPREVVRRFIDTWFWNGVVRLDVSLEALRTLQDSRPWALLRIAKEGAPERGDVRTIYVRGLTQPLPEALVPAVVMEIFRAAREMSRTTQVIVDITPYLALNQLTAEDVWQVIAEQFA